MRLITFPAHHHTPDVDAALTDASALVLLLSTPDPTINYLPGCAAIASEYQVQHLDRIVTRIKSRQVANMWGVLSRSK